MFGKLSQQDAILDSSFVSLMEAAKQETSVIGPSATQTAHSKMAARCSLIS